MTWYQRTLRWAQTNLTEKDPARYDADWWREHWRRTNVQGVIVNAGGHHELCDVQEVRDQHGNAQLAGQEQLTHR